MLSINNFGQFFLCDIMFLLICINIVISILVIPSLRLLTIYTLVDKEFYRIAFGYEYVLLDTSKN